jgi:hypothetical protein
LGDPYGRIVNAVTEGGSLLQLFEHDAPEWRFTNTSSGNSNATVLVGRDHFELYDPLAHGMSRPVEKQASVYMQPVSLLVLSLFMVEILLQIFVSGFRFFTVRQGD